MKIGVGSQAGTPVPPVPGPPVPALPVAAGHNEGSTVPGQPAAPSASRIAPSPVDHR